LVHFESNADQIGHIQNTRGQGYGEAGMDNNGFKRIGRFKIPKIHFVSFVILS